MRGRNPFTGKIFRETGDLSELLESIISQTKMNELFTTQCSPETSSIDVMWELIRNAEFRAQPRPPGLSLHFRRTPRRFVCTLKYENHWTNCPL